MNQINRNLNQARQAYLTGDIDLLKQAHASKSQSEIEIKIDGKHQELHKNEGDHLKSIVYGGLDGIITSFAVVAGAAGASLSLHVILIMGIANIVADGFGMGIGDYFSSLSEIEYAKNERKREEWEVENNPEGEKEEMQELYQLKGISKEDSIILSETMSQQKKVWIDIMMAEELGIIIDDENPAMGAFVTFLSFIFFGIIPLIPIIIGVAAGSDDRDSILISSLVLAIFALFILGVFKAYFVGKGYIRSGIETIILGLVATGIGFIIGLLLKELNIDNP